MYRRRVELRAAVGLPAATLTVGDSAGRLCYVTAAMGAVGIAVPLDDGQVGDLIDGLTAWRQERAADLQVFGRPCSSAQTPRVTGVAYTPVY